MEIKYVAVDGEMFDNKEECEAYESTSPSAIDAQFKKLPLQMSERFIENSCFSDFSYDDVICAVKIENAEHLEILNKWINTHHNPDKIGIDKIGTIQLIDIYGDDVWILGTPAEFKEKCCEDIDTLYSELIKKGENA